MKTADLDLEFGRGFRHEAEILEIASKHGVIMREGDGYWINGDYFKSQGEAEAYLATKSAVADELANALRNQLFEMAANEK